MSFFRKLFAPRVEKSATEVNPPPAPPAQPKEIGETDAICPYCHAQLAKKPGRKAKCPTCGNYIYVRTRPLDRQRVLVTENECELIERQWAEEQGKLGEYLENQREYEDIKDALRRQFGREPSKADVRWRIMNDGLIASAADGDWGIYRNFKLEMAQQLAREARYEAALRLFFEVCYLDANGAHNNGLISLKYAGLWQGVTGPTMSMISKLGLSEAQVKALYMEVVAGAHLGIKLPRTTAQTWALLREELFWEESEEE